MNKALAACLAAAAIVAYAGAARAETCIWLGYWACGDRSGVYTHFYTPPAAPNLAITPTQPSAAVIAPPPPERAPPRP